MVGIVGTVDGTIGIGGVSGKVGTLGGSIGIVGFSSLIGVAGFVGIGCGARGDRPRDREGQHRARGRPARHMSMRRGDHPGRPPGIEAVGRGYGAGKPFFVESIVVCNSPGAGCSSHGAGKPSFKTSQTKIPTSSSKISNYFLFSHQE